jgi:hypothetical protein
MGPAIKRDFPTGRSTEHRDNVKYLKIHVKNCPFMTSLENTVYH